MHLHTLWQTKNQIRKIINLVLNVLEEWYMLYLPHQKTHIWVAICQQTASVTFLTPSFKNHRKINKIGYTTIFGLIKNLAHYFSNGNHSNMV